MLDHLTIQVADVDAAAAFYLRVFAPLGVREAMRYDRAGSAVVGLSGAAGSAAARSVTCQPGDRPLGSRPSR